MRVVVDTNVFVSAILIPTSWPARVLDLVLTRRITLLVSIAILAEFGDVLRRKRLGLEKVAVEGFFQFIGAYAEIITVSSPEIHLPDPEDLPFLVCALAGKADFLITGNKKDFPDLVCRPVKIVSPVEFLRIL